jgi:hypothetical protein
VLHSIVGTEDVVGHVDPREYYLGDYCPGRFAWRLVDVVPVTPVPFRGAQGLRDLPEAVASSLRPLAFNQ